MSEDDDRPNSDGARSDRMAERLSWAISRAKKAAPDGAPAFGDAQKRSKLPPRPELTTEELRSLGIPSAPKPSTEPPLAPQNPFVAPVAPAMPPSEVPSVQMVPPVPSDGTRPPEDVPFGQAPGPSAFAGQQTPPVPSENGTTSEPRSSFLASLRPTAPLDPKPARHDGPVLTNNPGELPLEPPVMRPPSEPITGEARPGVPRPGRLILGGDVRPVRASVVPEVRNHRAPLLNLVGVKTNIGRYEILRGVDLAVPEGEVTMLLGRNGAGKTTTLRTIMGLWRAHQGEVNWAGEDLARLPTHAIARRGIGYVPEEMGVFSDLTVAENMRLGVRAGGFRKDRLDWLLAAFPALSTFWNRPAGTLSGGQKQMLALARTMVEPQRLYLIDEPTKGLAPAIVSSLASALRTLKIEGATILMVEQNFAVARALGDTCVVMEDGQTIWSGNMITLAEDQRLQDRLLGLGAEHGA